MVPAARSFILDLLSTLRRGSMPVRALVEAGGCLGLAENNVRVALARLRGQGLVESDERGRYRLGAAAEPVRRRASSWRGLRERVRSWDGSWVGVLTTGLAALPSRQRPRHERALWLLGFRRLALGLEVRPDNVRGGVTGQRNELRSLGLSEDAAVFRVGGLEPQLEARARKLWDTAGLCNAYRACLAELEASARRLPGLTESEAMRESFLLGGRAMRQLVMDPLLPEPIANPRDREALATALDDYDRLGRTSWARFLSAHGVPHLRAPADTRFAEGASRLASAGGGV
jgi:phenylacetic acid degradation operon negative regulatory protein